MLRVGLVLTRRGQSRSALLALLDTTRVAEVRKRGCNEDDRERHGLTRGYGFASKYCPAMVSETSSRKGPCFLENHRNRYLSASENCGLCVHT
jgi:hypothetical protein